METASHYPEKNITIAILTNSTKGRGMAEELEKILATAVLNINIDIKELPLSAVDINRYSGVYTYQSNPTRVSELKIFGENGRVSSLMVRCASPQTLIIILHGQSHYPETVPDGAKIQLRVVD